ncbi:MULTISPECIES: peptidoglycan-binding protein [Ruminococcus]|uniref:Peptidoglycan-binding (PGRP) domain of peptidoglycan hydrolases-containing protein n=1 Tax=Ruminococcus flavefaciens TaxID=1265 RepID=A0A1M7I2Z8_RUMFL|nr:MULTISPECIES: peptidoglycan-binding protein [Ruminococcus]MCR4795116.1 peptidoglycan-binding protein [Ruminococcus sp.]SHM35151.1 Peptidoglycan-binding (PGRP) domain of peptidoglycan hydrolases-containing protein [Ruminococcus flavefaciens]
MLTGTPFIPETITVHLGTPDSNAPDVTVGFASYIKNVASSEIYPTWPENALRANIYAIVSFALNRIYTEWYRSRGYDFDITATTQYDQKFINGREYFENISYLVDELFNDYVRRQGSVEPLFTAFCNGTTTTCEGLSQWGTVTLANRGLTPYEILQYYYGENIDIVKNAPVKTAMPSYSDTELKNGSFGNDVKFIQVWLNRISRNFPAIPKIPAADGIFDTATENAVRKFQQIFGLEVTGTVNAATWYRISYIYTSVKRLAELDSEGLRFEEISPQFKEELRIGMQSIEVSMLQYYLAVIGAYYEAVMPVEVTGYFGEQTERSVKSFQRVFGLPQTGVVDRATRNDLFRAYQGIVESVPPQYTYVALYPNTVLREGASGESVKIIQQYLTYINRSYPSIPAVSDTGYFGPLTRQSVTAFQRQFGIEPSGIVGAVTWDSIAGVYSDLRYGFDKRPYQNPGYTIK